MSEQGTTKLTEDGKIIKQARERRNYCIQFYGEAINRSKVEYKFAHGDSENNWQWDDDIYNDRDGADKPSLTINKTRQHNLLIKNDAKKNKPGIKFRPTGGAATVESAGVWDGLVRHIENISNAQAIYDRAVDTSVDCGVGYWRVMAKYKDNESFDQEAYIVGIFNPWNVALDPDAKEPDKSDARYGFIWDDVARDQFELKYPKARASMGDSFFVTVDSDGWMTDTHIRVAEYYRKVEKSDMLLAYVPEGSSTPVFLTQSQLDGMGPDFKVLVMKSPTLRKRPIVSFTVEWYLLAGAKIIDRAVVPLDEIPIVIVVPEETFIDGKYDRKGHTRAMMDAQRMYNYWSSAAVEYGALQTKTPWIASSEAIEGQENLWNKANVENASVLIYNALADDGITKIDAPRRIDPPMSAPAAIAGMQQASNEMMMASGQYQAMFGQPGNERSAKAIQERQRQGDTATYHYIDALALAIRRTGRLLLKLVPKIYDTQRITQILQEDGKSVEIMIDPSAQAAWVRENKSNEMALERIFNPSVGKYEVQADVGPSFGTKREEAFNAFTNLLGQAPQLIPILGDILFQAGDFPMAEQAAERLRRMVPPHALGEGPSPQEQQMMQQIEALKMQLGKALEMHAELSMKLKGKDQQKVVDVFNSITQRLKVLLDAEAASGQLQVSKVQMLLDQAVGESMDSELGTVQDASEPGLAAAAAAGKPAKALNAPPFPGARQGADGQWYGRDFSQSKQYRRV